MRVLGIESTCDETACAIVDDGVHVRSNVIASQADLHAVYRGVVPEIAARAHIENLLPTIQQALTDAGCKLRDVDAIAVAHRPGLIGSLLVGVTAAKALAWSLGKPLIGVDHVHAHLYSVRLCPSPGTPVEGRGEGLRASSDSRKDPHPNPLPAYRERGPEFPSIGFVCSGGHTALYAIGSWTDVTLLGKTIDDAVGEAYDKASAILGLGYPGGPILDAMAARGNPKAVRFPRSKLGKDDEGRPSLDFSFSGLKTAVLYNVRGYQGKERSPDVLSDAQKDDVAASFQQACIDVILGKLREAIGRIGAKSVIVGGGVSANRGLRAALKTLDVPAFVPAMDYCTDNAAMIAGLGQVLIEAGVKTDLDLDAVTMSSIK
jgi:N6-L-threonylcarbamoyladenine synthase